MLDLQDELPMRMTTDGGTAGITKSIGNDVFVSMAITRESADNAEEEPGGCQSACGGVLVCHGRTVLCFP